MSDSRSQVLAKLKETFPDSPQCCRTDYVNLGYCCYAPQTKETIGCAVGVFFDLEDAERLDEIAGPIGEIFDPDDDFNPYPYDENCHESYDELQEVLAIFESYPLVIENLQLLNEAQKCHDKGYKGEEEWKERWDKFFKKYE